MCRCVNVRVSDIVTHAVCILHLSLRSLFIIYFLEVILCQFLAVLNLYIWLSDEPFLLDFIRTFSLFSVSFWTLLSQDWLLQIYVGWLGVADVLALEC